ncbi:GlxA family transcriptional regulator [Nocardia mexicana]|uniref:Transcriptional regulator GlxA family with amidase domain n=1 Tax=Nocardia mexicana TaxID=279262 RepID=A0A370GNM3_9NOCA|nr:helix-turn-helix domain-containing protein [Nocardia mexicana]RDI45342.1 transcriptional regulator GlxA family with amidase domain [Nocardia mexicana]
MDVAVFVTDNVADFGLTAVLAAFATANALRGELDSPPDGWRIHPVSLGSSVQSSLGLVVPTTPFSDLPSDVGLMIVPAVLGLDGRELIELATSRANRPVLERISSAHTDGVHLASACTGTFFLAEAGVLDGGKATISWWLGPTFRRRYPRIDLDDSRLLCRSGSIVTAAASLAHLDLALMLIAAQSPALAALVSRYFLDGGRRTQTEFVVPEVISRGDSLVAEFERWVRDHIAEPFNLTKAARSLGVTVRSLQRATQSEIGMAPRDLVNEIRLERATQLLHSTSLTVDSVAAKVGYLHASTLRSLFRRRRGRSIAEVRATPLVWESELAQR